MKVLVTGVKGQLGYDVMNELAKRGYDPRNFPRPRHHERGQITKEIKSFCV